MAVLVMGCLSAQSMIVTLQGTSDQTANGYVAGQPVTFHFVINDGFGDTPATDYGTSIRWYETMSSTSLFAGIGGTGITGMFTKPAMAFADNGDYQSEVVISNSSLAMQLFYSGAYSPATGITASNGGTINVLSLSFNLDGSQSFPSSGYVYQTPESTTPLLAQTLSSFGGTYAVGSSSGGYMTSYGGSGDGYGQFTLTSMTIMPTSAIPEPSAFAALAGLMALGFAGCRRRPRG